MALQTLKEFGRRLIAPEAPWRIDTRSTYASVSHLSHCLSLPLYEIAESERTYIGRFYASIPESAAFITLRILHECMARNAGRQDMLERTGKQAVRVGVRLFGKDGQAAISDVYGMFSEAREGEAKEISEQVRILVRACLYDAAAVRTLRDYNDSLEAGQLLCQRFPSMASHGNDYCAAMGKHWLMTGKYLEAAFEPWLLHDKMQQQIDGLLSRYF